MTQTHRETHKSLSIGAATVICLTGVLLAVGATGLAANGEQSSGDEAVEVVTYDVQTGETSVSNEPLLGDNGSETARIEAYEGLVGMLDPPGEDGELTDAISSDEDEPTATPQEPPASAQPGSPEEESVIGSDDRTRITSTTSYPWRTIAKVYFQTPGGGYSMCSGSVIDSFHVLTAGHCVHEGNGGDWMQNLRFLPGMDDGWRTWRYDERAIENSEYAYAEATTLRSYTGWTQSGDRDHDWAVVTLDRPVGDWTGWMGRKTASSGSSVYTGTLNSAGYPGDLDNGRNMYWDADTGCSADTYRHFYNMDTAGGQSGMPIWQYDGSNRYILTVHTTGGGGASCGNGGTRLNQDKFDRIISWTDADTKPDHKADLIERVPDDWTEWNPNQDFSDFGPDIVSPGSTSFSVNMDVRNMGTTSSGGFYVSYYASTNDFISTSDTFIGRDWVPSIGAFNNADSSWSGTFPSGVSDGTYHIGWIIDDEERVDEYDDSRSSNVGVQGSHTLTVDGTPPNVDVDLTCPDSGDNGWCKDGVSVDFSYSDSGTGLDSVSCKLDGSSISCFDRTVSTDGMHAVEIEATDLAGNTASDSASFKVDEVPPEVSLDLSCREEGNGDWCVAPVDLGNTVTDATSGVQQTDCTLDGGSVNCGSITEAGEGSHTYQVTAEDNAGWTESDSTSFKIDTVAPASSASTQGTRGNNGWYTSSVDIALACSDATSGCETTSYRIDGGNLQTYSGAFTLSSDGTHTVEFYSVDMAGNQESTQSLEVKIDTTAPSVSAEATCDGAESGGWCPTSVSLSGSASDATSGVSSVDCALDGSSVACDSSASSEGSHVFEVTAVDEAGNTGADDASFKIDTTTPSTDAALDGTSGSNGWYVSTVDVTLGCQDALSGCDVTQYRVDGGSWQTYSGVFTLSSDGTHTVEFYSVDVAGNVEDTQSLEVKIDQTAPSVSAGASCDGTESGGWCPTSVTLSGSASDAMSGVSSVDCALDGSSVACDSSASSEGSHVFEALAVDEAGNTGADDASFKVDTTTPSTDAALDGTSGSNGWYVSTVDVSLDCGDALSGCDSTSYRVDGGSLQTYSGVFTLSSDGTHTVEFYSVDVAGNVEDTQSLEVKIDTTAPSVSAEATCDGAESGGWCPTSVSLSGSASDATSGVSSVDCQLDGSSVGCQDTSSSEGSHVFEALAVDEAGNTGADDASFKVDTTTPSTDADLDGITGSNGWYTSDVDVSLDCSDALSGCDETVYQLDGGAETTYTGPFSVTGDGEHTLVYWSTDEASNAEAENDVRIPVDTTTPTASIGAPEEATTSDEFEVAWSGTDATSGVACMDVQVDDGSGWTLWKSCASPGSDLYKGRQGETYQFRSRAHDVAGNDGSYPGEAQAEVYVNQAPEADAGPDQEVIFAENLLDGVRVNASNSTDADGAVEEVCFDWGDGTPEECGEAMEREHTYARPTGQAFAEESYTVEVTVVDDDGRSGSDTAEIQVPLVATP